MQFTTDSTTIEVPATKTDTSPWSLIWRDASICRGDDPTDWIEIPKGKAGARIVREHKQLCSVCPVRVACLCDALDHPDWSLGVWGGTTEVERESVLHQLRDLALAGKDIRESAVWELFEHDPSLVRAVNAASDGAMSDASLLVAGKLLPTVVSLALLARWGAEIALAILKRGDQAHVVHVVGMALLRRAGKKRRYWERALSSVA